MVDVPTLSMIRDSATELLADACDSAAVRKSGGFDAALWKRMAEMGWCGTAIPEADGGLGMGPAELVLIVEQLGRFLAPTPFLSSVCLAGSLIAQAANVKTRKALLPRIADGSLLATVVFDAPLRVVGNRISGRLVVPDGADAELILVVYRKRIYAVERAAAGVTARPQPLWDISRRQADVTLKNVVAQRIEDPRLTHGIEDARALSRLYLAAEQLGGAQQCLDLILRYTSERKQFGRAIASFQAVKHRCAQLMVMVESLRSLVYGAAEQAMVGRNLTGLALECAAAKAQASDTYFHAAGECIQLHGGVGFTTEFDPQLHFKRAQGGSHWLGAPDVLRESIAQALLA